MHTLRKLVLDVLKPFSPSALELAKRLLQLRGVKRVEVSLIEMDRDVENVKITLEGNLDYELLKKEIEKLGASIHSIDGVTVEKR